MENNNQDESKQPKKKSHKRKKQTIKETQVELKKEKAKSAPAKLPKDKDKVAKYNTRLSLAGKNLEGNNKKLQNSVGVCMDRKTTLPYARDKLITPTKTARDAGKMVRHNFLHVDNMTRMKVATSSKRKKVFSGNNEDDENAKEQTSQRKVPRSENTSNGAESPPKPLLGINMRKLILEDFILLELGTDVRILVSPNHSTYDHFSKLPHESVMQWDSSDPSTRMYCYDAVVTTNAQLSGLSNGMWTRERLMHLMTYEGGGAVIFVIPGTNRTSIQLKWAEFVEHCTTLQLWAEIPNHRDFRKMLLPKRKNRDNLTQLYNRLVKEVFGDKGALCLVHSAYRTVLAELTKSSTKESKEDLTPKDKPEEFYIFINELVKKRIDECYGNFVNLQSPVLSQEDMTQVIQKLQQTCPQELSLTKQLLRIDERIKRKGDIMSLHLFPHYEKLVFWKFFSNQRMRFNQLLTPMASVVAAALYAKAASKNGQQVANYFGVALHPQNLRAKMKMYRADFDIRTKESLRKFAAHVYTFDNGQKGESLKHQRGGSCNKFAKFTAQCYTEPILPKRVWTRELKDLKASITYFEQDIPSPPGMLPYEILFHPNKANPQKMVNDFKAIYLMMEEGGIASPVADPLIDVSGRRVHRYADILDVVFELRNQSKYAKNATYQFQPEHLNSDHRRAIMDALVFNHQRKGLYPAAYRFQRLAVHTFREGSDTIAKVLIPRVSLEDETTNKGSGDTVMKYLLNVGVVKLDFLTKEWELGENWAEMLEIIVGDGLTMERIRNFERDLGKKGREYVQHFKKMEVFLTAISRVIKLSGDLHLCFHFLGTVYLPYYPGFLQLIQSLLGWKKMDASDIAQTFQTGSDFVFLVSGVCEKLIFDLYMHEKTSVKQKQDEALAADNPEALAMLMALEMSEFLGQLRSGGDQVWSLIANFIYYSRRYKKLRLSLHVGDPVMTEVVSVQHLPVFLALGRSKYFAIGVEQLEQNYGDIDGEQLSYLRHNRTRRMREGTTSNGQETGHWTMDGIIESHMPKYKKLGHANTPEAFVENSPDMPFCSRAHEFVSNEFRHVADAETAYALSQGLGCSPNSDVGCIKKQTTVPRRTIEKIMIMEWLVCLTGGKIVEGRQYSFEIGWNKLSEVTTAFDKSQKSSQSTYIPASANEMDEEKEMARTINEMYDLVVDDFADDSQEVEPVVPGEDMQQDDSFGIGDSFLDPDREDDNEDVRLETASVETTGVATVGSTAVSNITLRDGRKIKLPEIKSTSKFAFKDLDQDGRKLMEKKDITAVRHRMKQRRKREKEVLSSSLYVSLTKESDGGDETAWEEPTIDSSFRDLFCP
jgi:hypothetical protein